MTADVDPAAEFYAALGYVVRELGAAHDTLNAVMAGMELESVPGAILAATHRIDHVYAVAAELRARYG